LAEDKPNNIESALDRAQRVREYVERLIAEVGEHPECELKREWRRDSVYHKAEFVKDFQSIANSAIPVDGEKYIVVGADESTRAIVGCSHADFDEAGIRQVLETYLDPVPRFEVLRLTSTTGVHYVVIRIPHQIFRPFIAKATIRDNNKIHLDEGQIWVKPGGADTGSTGKRLLRTREELLGMIDVNPLVQRAVEERLEQVIPEIRLAERTRLHGGAFTTVSALGSSDEEFEGYVEQILSSNNENSLNIIIERLRDKTVSVWDYDASSTERPTVQKILEIKETEFLPGMRRLVHLGLLLIKFSAPRPWFNRIADLLQDIFEVTNQLGWLQSQTSKDRTVTSLEEHTSHTIPALESLIAAHLLGSYELNKKDGTKYLSTFFPRIVKPATGPHDEWVRLGFYIFWPVTTMWGFPNRRRDLLVVDRYGRGDRIEGIFGGKERMKTAALQLDCLIDWHSFMSFQHYGEPETIKYFETTYPDVINVYHQRYYLEPFNYIMPLVDKLWRVIQGKKQKNFYLLDLDLANAFEQIDISRRKQLLARFLATAENDQAQWMFANGRIPYQVRWPSELEELVRAIKSSR
jgi:hypothetical protein